MLKGAPRLLLRALIGISRGAGQALCAVMAVWVCAAPGGATPPNVIIDAQFEAPTTRYNHAVLGPDAEWGALRLTVDQCIGCETAHIREYLIELPQERVFEDLTPRIVDLDFDESPEVVVIESHASFGARLSVYSEAGLIAATPWIGTSFRWLAPLGAADLDGDGLIELAYIDRPHLAKTLRVWRYENRELVEIAVKAGLTNHKIGQAFISGGIRNCGDGPEIITADARWRRVIATKLANNALESRDIGKFNDASSLTAAVNCK